MFLGHGNKGQFEDGSSFQHSHGDADTQHTADLDAYSIQSNCRREHIFGSDHRLCVVSTQLNFRMNHDVSRGVPHRRDWSSTLLRTHVDFCQGNKDVSCRLAIVVPCDVASRAGVVDELCPEVLGHFIKARFTSAMLPPHAVSTHGGPQSAVPRVSPGMVHGVIIYFYTR